MKKSEYLSLAKKYGTPLYVYDEAVIRRQCQKLRTAFPNAAIHYAVKANSNPALLRIIESEKFHVECVSLGELALVQSVGFPKERISFTCSNLTEGELLAASKTGARIHLDSLEQVRIWGERRLGKEISVRLNQGIGAGHHSHVITGGPDSKFGISLADVPTLLKLSKKYGLTVTGLQQHIGSNVLTPAMFLKAMKTLFATALVFPELSHLDFGGGFGIAYRPQQSALDLPAVSKGFSKLCADFEKKRGKKFEYSFEPGRYLVAEAGTLLVTVVDRKATSKHAFVGVNSGFNQLIRPAMYGSYHPIQNVSRSGKTELVTVAGNVCESGDVFATHRAIATPKIGDVLAIECAGAYGFSMASYYNLHAPPREVLVSGGKARDISFDPKEYAR